jgi:hypothetical protein
VVELKKKITSQDRLTCRGQAVPFHELDPRRGLQSATPRRGDKIMAIRHLMILNAAALAASMSVSHAGPCSPEIDRAQAVIDARLGAIATAGPQAQESTSATMHHQPTPGSIAAAEERLGELSRQKTEAAEQAMARARAADSAGDKSACEQALADVERAIGH